MTTNTQPTFTPRKLFETTVDAIKRVFQRGYYERSAQAYVVVEPRFSSRDPYVEQRIPMTPAQHEEYHMTRMRWLELVQRFDVHPCVAKALDDGHLPMSITALVSEWPHISTTDADRLAYTCDDRALKDDRQTVTSVGKYLRRHFPQLADHIIRDLVASYTPDECYIVNTKEEIIAGIEFGPRSCMQSGYESIPFDSDAFETLQAWSRGEADADEVPWHMHPYAVYCPTLGWGMALRKSAGQIDGRALLWTDPQNPDYKVFVRSYKRPSSGDGHSHADDMLEQWLLGQGYKKIPGWPGAASVKRIPYCGDEDYDGPLVPYIDGCNDRLTRSASGETLRFDSNGELLCDNTDGTATNEEPDWYCEDCDEGHDEGDDRYWVGHDEDRCVCEHCIDDYTWVAGRHNHYYLPNNDAATLVDYRGRPDGHVDPEDLPRGVVELSGGNYASREDCVCINDEWYLESDPDVVKLAEECPVTGDRYALKDDAWEDYDGAWHSKHIEQTETETE